MQVAETQVNCMGGYLFATITFVLMLSILISGNNDTQNSPNLTEIKTSTHMCQQGGGSVDWRSVVVDGAFTALIALFVGVGGTVINGCGFAITDRIHLTTNSCQGGNEKACYAAIAAYIILCWGEITFILYAKGRGWMLTNGSYRV